MRHLTQWLQQVVVRWWWRMLHHTTLLVAGDLLCGRGMMFLQSRFSPQLSCFLARNKCFDASPISKVYAGLIFAFMILLTYAEPEFDTECCINRRGRNTWPFQLDRSIEVIVRSLSCLDSWSFTVFITLKFLFIPQVCLRSWCGPSVLFEDAVVTASEDNCFFAAYPQIKPVWECVFESIMT